MGPIRTVRMMVRLINCTGPQRVHKLGTASVSLSLIDQDSTQGIAELHRINIKTDLKALGVPRV